MQGEKKQRPRLELDVQQRKERKFGVGNPLVDAVALQKNQKYGGCNEQVQHIPDNTKVNWVLDCVRNAFFDFVIGSVRNLVRIRLSDHHQAQPKQQ